MLDTMYRDQGIRDGRRYFDAHSQPEGLYGDVGCSPLPPEAPLSVDGVRTDVEPIKPSDR